MRDAAAPAEMLDVLRRVRDLLARPGNEFTWSSWEDRDEALAEIDRWIAQVATGAPAGTSLDVLFAPTGPIQEVAESRGSGTAFRAVAARFDAAVAGYRAAFG